MQEQAAHTQPASHAFNAVVDSVQDDTLVLKMPGRSYQLHLAAPQNGNALEPGQRVRGIVRGESLRMYSAHGGGKFIEPVWGAPRIVAGIVLEAHPAKREVIVDAVAVFKLRVPKEQNFDLLVPGALVNFYINSGAAFEPVA